MTVSRCGGGDLGTGDFRFWNETSGIRAYSVGTTSCNEGDVELPWISEEVHIGNNFYKIEDGRLSQLGYSWLKLGFCAVNESSCGTCQATPCATLGVGCADTYSSWLNDGSSGHDKSDVNPTVGRFIAPPSTPSGVTGLRGRLQVQAAEMGRPNATYFAESQYLYEGDLRFGNGRNNVTWKEINTTSSSTQITGTGHSSHRYECAIEAWAHYDPLVQVVEVVNMDEPTAIQDAMGHYVVGYRVEEIDSDQWRYDYAIQNLTSDQCVSSLNIPVCEGVITDTFFDDVERHSGTPWDNTDWVLSNASGQLSWTCSESHEDNENANAIHWGEVFSFGFTSNIAPARTWATLGLFKPGPRSVLSVEVMGPCFAGAERWCTASPNSYSDDGARMSFHGSPSITANDLLVTVVEAPPGQDGIFFAGDTLVQQPFGGGILCATGIMHRIGGPVSVSALGRAGTQADLEQYPFDSFLAVTPGETRYFQFWYRDANMGAGAVNTSNVLGMTYTP